jgi:phosphoenolpyruvate---glycerone phosphotransferase subunit DhaM
VSVGLVVVSHSAKIAEGVVELAGQMAGAVRIQAAGGTDDGGIGTNPTLIAEAIAAADEGEGVLVLVDLGSAVLSAQLAIEELVDEETRARVRIAEAPVVEGAVVAAVQAGTGSSLEEVDQAARGAATMAKVKPQAPGGPGEVAGADGGPSPGGAPADQVGR